MATTTSTQEVAMATVEAGSAGPVPGNCMAKGVVYGAEITDLATGNKETYTGLTDGTIRDRISKH